jgi:hypothetical protein
MRNLMANSIDLARVALDEILTRLSGSAATPDGSGAPGAVGRRPATDERAGVINSPGARLSYKPGSV